MSNSYFMREWDSNVSVISKPHLLDAKLSILSHGYDSCRCFPPFIAVSRLGHVDVDIFQGSFSEVTRNEL